MKTDRLLGITMYLLNREVVPASELAEKFEVSVRTIARDMEALDLAGIPIASTAGAGGGYRIMDSFRLGRPVSTAEDYQHVIAALKTLCSAYENKNIEATLEKLLAVQRGESSDQRVFVDFSVVREGERTPAYTALVEQAIGKERVVTFAYSDAQGAVTQREVEPLALNYRWYAWYLLAWCLTKQDYRIFKLNRMEDLAVTGRGFTHRHGDIPALLKQQWARDDRECLKVRLLCKAQARPALMEYFRVKIIAEHPDGSFECKFYAIESERWWFSLLMGFGGQVQVLEPPELAERVQAQAEDILRCYQSDQP